LDHLVAGISAAIAPENRYRFRIVDHLHKLIQVGIGRAEDGWVRDRHLPGHLWPMPRPMPSAAGLPRRRQTIALTGDGGFTMLALGDC